MRLGVSIVICCHNSAQELPKTLEHLALQKVTDELLWEVLIIDNASKDDTANIAHACWPESSLAPLRVVHEPRLGLINARYRALAEAKYEVISFIDDDNWVCSNWVQTASLVMSQHPEVGACGGNNLPEFDEEKPAWFDLSPRSYAVGPQGPEEGGDITWSRGRLVGAGLTIRKLAWQKLVDDGFQSLLVGCKGKALNRGEDTELAFALVLAGWRLWYEPHLILRHHLPTERLEWSYLRRLRRNGGKATIGFDPYRFALEEIGPENQISFWWTVARGYQQASNQTSWSLQALSVLKGLIRNPRKLVISLLTSMEGDPDVLRIEMKIGRLLELFNSRKVYATSIEDIRDGAWRCQKSDQTAISAQ